jgi:peptidoglycan/LPS O-acetylase OafA/YrhL
MADVWTAQARNLPFLSLLAVVFAAAVGICVVRPPWLLRLAPLRHIGRLSYGLYLYHMPAFALVRTHFASPEPMKTVITELVVTYLMAAVSWYGMEMWLNGLKSRFTRP